MGVEDMMEDKVEASEDNSEEVKETLVEDTKGNGEETEEATSKNDLNCTKCVEENEGGTIETHEVETEYDKPDRTLNFLKGFGKRVILCTLLIFIAKTAWPRIQPIVWPEEPVKEGKLYILTDRSFRGHIKNGEPPSCKLCPWVHLTTSLKIC